MTYLSNSILSSTCVGAWHDEAQWCASALHARRAAPSAASNGASHPSPAAHHSSAVLATQSKRGGKAPAVESAAAPKLVTTTLAGALFPDLDDSPSDVTLFHTKLDDSQDPTGRLEEQIFVTLACLEPLLKGKSVITTPQGNQTRSKVDGLLKRAGVMTVERRTIGRCVCV